jgi:hypothetical protein
MLNFLTISVIQANLLNDANRKPHIGENRLTFGVATVRPWDHRHR